MIVFLSMGLIFHVAYFYILLASIPVTSAAIRNIRWFAYKSDKELSSTGVLTVAISYVIFESIPPMLGVIHFFTVGIYEVNFPAHIWAFMVVPGVSLSLLTFYWSAIFFKKTVRISVQRPVEA